MPTQEIKDEVAGAIGKRSVEYRDEVFDPPHLTPNGIPLNYDAVGREIYNVIVKRNGFQEPELNEPHPEVGYVEMALSDIFLSVLVPIAHSMEALRKGKMEAAREGMSTAAFNAKRVANAFHDHEELPATRQVVPRNALVNAKLALVVTELVEVHDNGYDFRDLADAIIRIQCMAAAMGVPLDEFMAVEMEHNSQREFRHGKHA